MPDIRYPVADNAWPGYLAVPSALPGPWPAVVVIHEAFGLNDDIRAKADEFAARGYLALAPDLFDGKSWIRCIRSAFGQLRAGRGPAFTALDAARTFLAARPDCTGKAGVIGFCLGGGFALLCAPRPGFDVAAVNYGDVPKDAESVLAGACPVVGSFGGRDQMGTQHPERLERALSVLEVPHDVHVYPASGHRFMTESDGVGAVFARLGKMSYQPEDAADAWKRIFAFFGTYLDGQP
ncbi:MAG TPA: dienelactone hydrolase family protein [Streptosporangiaceae bacterium]|jgi:carboxymethylenebutenolidase|nr:dienelactone hydrolase family protein [Streptosporangiaceae bacterium]